MSLKSAQAYHVWYNLLPTVKVHTRERKIGRKREREREQERERLEGGERERTRKRK